MKLSIIIPVYNSESFLPTCLNSLLSQGLDSDAYEILIINDGSKDKSLEVSQLYANNHKNILVFDKENGGVGSARNKGISIARGKYIYFIDPDDYLVEDVLHVLLDKAEENNLDILTFKSKQVRKVEISNYKNTPSELEMSPTTNGLDYISGNTYKNEVWWYLIKKEFIEEHQIQFIEGRWMEDAIFTTQAILKAKLIAHINLNAHRHLIVAGSAMTNKEPSHYLKVIEDNRNAAIVFESLIDELIAKNSDHPCINRLRTRQQSFVFFMQVRILKSTITLDQVKIIFEDIYKTNAYPLTNFISKDYNKLIYKVLVEVFNNKKMFFTTFRLLNPILRRQLI